MDQNRANQVRGLLGRIKADGLVSLRQRQRSAEGKGEDQLRELLDLGGPEAALPQTVGAPVPILSEEEQESPETETLPPRRGNRPSRPAP
jgi:hypothetical protein